MEEYQTFSARTFYHNTWKNTPGNFAVEKPINKAEGNPKSLNSWNSDFRSQTTKKTDDQDTVY